MKPEGKKPDIILAVLIVLLLLMLPVAIKSYDQFIWNRKLPEYDKMFTLTGHTEQGWILGDVKAVDIFTLWNTRDRDVFSKPVIEVKKGDRVVLKLKSSDVTHGFSFKEAGIFITDGIVPGKVTTVSFTADKVGTFTFACNAICGSNHENMQGTLIVRV